MSGIQIPTVILKISFKIPGLGEHKWLEPKKAEPQVEEVEEVEVEITSEHRPNNIPAGLINLGNTCYVNSFLQIWFHNVWLRCVCTVYCGDMHT